MIETAGKIAPFFGSFADLPPTDPRHLAIRNAFALLTGATVAAVRSRIATLINTSDASPTPPWFSQVAKREQKSTLERLSAAFADLPVKIEYLRTDDFSFGLMHLANALIVEEGMKQGRNIAGLRQASAAFRLAYDTLTCRGAE